MKIKDSDFWLVPDVRPFGVSRTVETFIKKYTRLNPYENKDGVTEYYPLFFVEQQSFFIGLPVSKEEASAMCWQFTLALMKVVCKH